MAEERVRRPTFPAVDAATKAEVLTAMRAIYGDDWSDEDTGRLYETMLVLDRLGLLVVRFGEPQPVEA